MSLVSKKPYEISLWEDELWWASRELREVNITKEDYATGKYFYNPQGSSKPKVCYLSQEVYNKETKYYEMVPKIKFSNGKANYIESSKASDLDDNPPYKNSSSVADYCGRVSFYKEKKICTIGSNTMDTPIRAMKPKLVSKINGENTLTFTVYFQYFDEDSQELVWNPFIQYLTNERKVKLQYDGKWYDFVIKNITEDSASKAFEYTCKDLYINELSKTGFELEFDNELENNMGNLNTLATRILEDSDWKLKDEENEDIFQYIEEPLYKFKFANSINAKRAFGPNNSFDSPVTIPAGAEAYAFYSSVKDESTTEVGIFEFLYSPNGYSKDDKNIIVGYSKENPKGACNYFINNVVWGEIVANDKKNLPKVKSTSGNNTTYTPITEGLEFVSDRRGQRLVKSQKTEFDSNIDETVTVYTKNGKLYYAYKKTDYISPIAVQSYVANSKDFSSTTGWSVGKNTETGDNNSEKFPSLDLEAYPALTRENFSNYTGVTYLKFSPNKSKQMLMNSGIYNNRNTIETFTKDEIYILTTEAYKALANKTKASNYSLAIGTYTFEGGVYKIEDKIFDISAPTGVTASDGGKVNKYECTCIKSFSKEELEEAKIGIFLTITDTTPIYIKNMEFYPLKYSTNSEGQNVECYPGAMLEAVVKDKWYVYEKPSGTYNVETLKYDYQGEQDPKNKGYTPHYGEEKKEAYEKVRSITAKESNRFNLLQNLCELFECWARFEIDHDSNGAIILEDDYRQSKWVYYQQFIGKENYIGFRYGTNLKSIKRTLDSSGTISKIIVKNNANEFASGGFCSISRATENPSGENTIYNFDYYIGQKLLNFSTVNNDLYFQPKNTQGYLGYYKALKVLNDKAKEKAETLAGLLADIADTESYYTTYKLSYETAQEEIAAKEQEFENLTGIKFEKALPIYQLFNPTKHYLKYYKYDASKHSDGYKGNSSWWKDDQWTWMCYKKNDDKTYSLYTGSTQPTEGSNYYVQKRDWYKNSKTKWEFFEKEGDNFTKIDTQPGTSSYARLKWWDNTEAEKIYNSIARNSAVVSAHKTIYENQQENLNTLNATKASLEKEIATIRESKLALNRRFYKKYSRFIQEGSWVSEDYMDDNLYYIDALSTLYTSSRPQVSYTIDVIELSAIDEYSDYVYSLGDKTYIEDKEFFGWAYDGSNQMYKEEVIISEITVNLDSPESNKLKVQNYKTQFEDLFSRVVAATQQLQFSTGEYKRTANIINEDGTISVSTLQNSFANNAFTLSNAKDQSVIIGDDGITTTNLSRPSEIVRIISGGIFLSKDGGQTWTAGITAAGINASCLTTGSIDASSININMGNQIAFRWDKLGISAYQRSEEEGISPGIFTRFDQFGIYGITHGSDFDPLKNDDGGNNTLDQALEKIKTQATFGLTWDGFWLKSDGTNGYVSISSDKDFEVIRKNEEMEYSVIQIGRLESNNSEYYGIRISKLDEKDQKVTVMETNQKGELWLRDKLIVETDASSTNSTVSIGNLGTDSNYSVSKKVIDANDKFKVFADGHLEGTDAHFSGGSVFEGKIMATGGQIGGLTIEEWKEMGLSVRIESSAGWVLKDNTQTKLKATLYFGAKPCNSKTLEVVENNGSKTEYNISYLWTGNTSFSGNKNDREISVSLSKENTTAEFTCAVTLTQNSGGKS